jgi:hypothetical protein
MITWAERAKVAISQTVLIGTAKTDEMAVNRLLSVSAVPNEGAFVLPPGLSSVSAVRSPAVFEKHDISIATTQDPDRWCWPYSSAMNGAEIDTYAMRQYQFTDKGLTRKDGAALADKLVMRDRESDDRRVCVECKHFAGHVAGSWRCDNWQAAGFGIGLRDAQLSADLVLQLQLCNGFTP